MKANVYHSSIFKEYRNN